MLTCRHSGLDPESSDPGFHRGMLFLDVTPAKAGVQRL